MIQKLLLVSLIIGYADCQRRVSRPDLPSYVSGTEYRYEYETQVLTGLPGSSNIYSALKFRMQARLQFQSASDVVLQMTGCQMFEVNGRLDEMDPTKNILPDSMFTEISGPEVHVMSSALAKAVSFSYVHGDVARIHFQADDPHWSVNIKKGFLSFLVIELDQSRALEAPPTVLRNNRVENGVRDLYTVMEPSVVGNCETFYRLLPADDTNFVKFSKVRNYENCVDRPSFTYSIFNEMPCANCSWGDFDPLISTSILNYDLRGNSRHFLIAKATSESTHVFTPYYEEGGRVAVYINQTVFFTESKDIQDSIPMPSSPTPSEIPIKKFDLQKKKKGSLGKLLDHPDFQGLADVDRCNPFRCANSSGPECPTAEEKRDSRIRINQLLSMLVAHTLYDVEEEAAPLVPKLVEEFRMADFSVLYDLWQSYGDRSPGNQDRLKKRKIMVDLLPTSGTVAAFYVMKTAIERNQLHSGEISTVLTTIAVHALPEFCLATHMQAMSTNSIVTNPPEVKRAFWLAYSVVVSKIDRTHLKEMEVKERSKRLAQKWLQTNSRSSMKSELERKVSEVTDSIQRRSRKINDVRSDFVQSILRLLQTNQYDDKELALKAIGNAGLREFFPNLESIVRDKSVPAPLRTQAVYSLCHLSFVEPELVRDLCLQRFTDVNEEEEVRAFSLIFFSVSRPPRPLLEYVAKWTQNETNPHMKAFIYSFFEQMSNITDPCLQKFVEDVQYARRFIDRYEPKMYESRVLYTDSYNERLKMGMNMATFLISNRRDIVPKFFMTSVSSAAFGREANVFEVGASTSGLQDVLQGLLGPGSKWSKGGSLSEIFDSTRVEPRNRLSQTSHETTEEYDDEERENKAKDIQEQLQVEHVRSLMPKAHVYFKLFGYELQYYPIETKILQDMSNLGKIKVDISNHQLRVSRSWNLYKSTVFFDIFHTFPSEFGAPINLKLHGSNFLKMDGNFSATTDSSILSSQLLPSAHVALHLIPRTSTNIHAKMEVDALYFRSGFEVMTSFKAGSPLFFTFSYNPHNKSISGTYDISSLNTTLANFKVTPFTLIEKVPNDITQWPLMPDIKEIEVVENALSFPFIYEIPEKYFGVNLKIKGISVSRNFLTNVPFCPLSGKQWYFLTILPGARAPSGFAFQFVPIFQEQTQGDRNNIRHVYRNLKKSMGIGTSNRGFIFRVHSYGSTLDKFFEVNGLWQLHPNFKKAWFVIKRSPYENEQDVWEILADLDLNFASKIDIHNLFDVQYQQDVIQSINRIEVPDKCLKDSLKHIPEYQITKEEKWESPMNSIQTIDKIMDKMIYQEKSLPSLTSPVLNIIQIVLNQKDLIRKLKEHTSKKMSQKKLEDMVLNLIQDSSVLKEQLDDKPVHSEPKVNTLIKYAVLKQQTAVHLIQKIVRTSRSFLAVEIREQLDRQLGRLWLDINLLHRKQDSIDTLLRSHPSMSKEALTQLKVDQNHLILRTSEPTQQPYLEDIPLQLFRNVVNKSKEVESRVIEDIKHNWDITGNDKMKILEVLIQQHQLMTNVDVKVAKVKRRFGNSRPSYEEPLLKMKRAMKNMNKRITDLIAQFQDIKTSQYRMESITPANQQQALNKLKQIKLLQIIAFNSIKSIFEKLPVESTGLRDTDQIEEKKRMLQISLQEVRRTHELLSNIAYSSSAFEPMLLIEAIECAHRQVKICKTLVNAAQKVEQMSLKSSLNDNTLRQLHEEAQNLLITQISQTAELATSAKSVSVQTESSGRTEFASDINDHRSIGNYRQHITMRLHISFGPETHNRKSFTIEITGTKSLEQMLWELKQSLNSEQDPLIEQYFKDPQDDKLKKKIEIKLNELHRFYINCSYNVMDFPLYVKEYLWKFYERSKYHYFPHLTMSYPPSPSSGNIQSIFNIYRNNLQMDMTFLSSYVYDQFYGLPIPFIYRIVFAYLQRDPHEKSIHPQDVKIVAGPRHECKMKANYIWTFDDSRLKLPPSDECDVILAMDCSSAAHFAIKIQRTLDDPLQKIVKIVLDNKDIELFPEGNRVSLKVNNQRRFVTENTPYTIRSHGYNTRNMPMAVVKRKGNMLVVMLQEKGVYVETDSNSIIVKVSPYYYSKLCGICGNYDGVPGNDKSDPKQLQQKDNVCLLASYVQSHGQCYKQQYIRGCQHSTTQTSPRQPQDECKPVQKIIYRVKKNKEKICFTKVPVNKCPRGCIPENRPIRIRVPMTCLDTASSKAHQIRLSLLKGKVPNLIDEPVSEQRQFSEEIRCTVA